MARRTINLPAKTAGQLIKDADDVLRVAGDRRGTLIRGLITRRGEFLPDSTLVPYGAAIDICLDPIRDARDQLVTVDYAHRDEEGNLEALRIDRRHYLKEAGQAVLSTRTAFEGFFGEKISFLAGFPRILPANVREMIDHGQHLSDRLRNPEPEVAELFTQQDADAAAFYDKLDPAIAKLAMAEEKFRVGQTGLEEATIARLAEMDNLRDVLVPGAQGISALFRLAGLTELASRVRRSVRRTRRTDDDEEPGQEASEPQGSAEAAETPTSSPDSPAEHEAEALSAGSQGAAQQAVAPPVSAVDGEPEANVD